MTRSADEFPVSNARMRTRIVATLLACGACGGAAEVPTDPIEGFPAAQQQTIMRATVDKDWPLTVGRGTLGCQSGAVVLRFNGVSYAVNDAARAQGFASIDGIRGDRPSPPPTHPLSRITQEKRMEVFADLARCAASTDCTNMVGARHRLTSSDLRLILDEGNERLWPPLERSKADLKPLVDRGLKLCNP